MCPLDERRPGIRQQAASRLSPHGLFVTVEALAVRRLLPPLCPACRRVVLFSYSLIEIDATTHTLRAKEPTRSRPSRRFS
jgi:hypothetical protein